MKFSAVYSLVHDFVAKNPNGVVVVVGPTASGKTSLSIEIAKFLSSAEIINADSRQIYSGLPILTAVPTDIERAGVPHHLFETIIPENPINVSQWKDMAEACIAEIQKRGNTAIICGGTGLWINALTKNFSLGVGPSEEFRTKMHQKTNDELWELLMAKDPESAKSLHKNNTKYVIRALEICEEKGSKSLFATAKDPLYPFLLIGITHPRTMLYQRIEERNTIMLSQGVVEEVQNFLSLHPNTPSMDSAFISHGVPEIKAYLAGDVSLDAAKETMIRITKNYAKRQLTWWRRDARVHWINGQDGNYIDIKDKQW